MNILLLGATGYLGGVVAHRLVEDKHDVVCCRRADSSMDRLSDIADKVKFIRASEDAVEAISLYMDFDVVLNMASNYGRSDVLYGDVIEANIEFPLRIMNKIVEIKCRDGKNEAGNIRYITIGTGLPDELNMYSYSKRMFNEFGRFYADKHGINFDCLKLEMFYGDNEPKDRFLPGTIRKMINGEPVDTTIGTQHRDIISVTDVVDAVMYVMNSNLTGYNEIEVGTGIAPTIAEIVDYIWEQTGRKSVVNKGAVPMRPNEPDCVADTGAISSICEWKPVFWKDGLADMISKMSANKDIVL